VLTSASAVATLLLAALVVPQSPLSAQSRAEKAPKRPPLPEGADTNSGIVYFMYGKSQLPKFPQRAADAFYWSSRIQPGVADVLYARRIALLLSDKRRLVRYFRGQLSRDAEVQRIDSLHYYALLRDPFLDEHLDGMLLDEFLYELTGEYTPVGAVGDPEIAAWLAKRDRNFPQAAEKYAAAIKRYPKQYGLRAERAQVLYQMGQFDSALVELTRMRDALSAEDKKNVVRVYDSKAMIEYRIGRIHARTGNLPAAREAYGRALAEDLSFFMGHVALADLAMAQHDTATALSELDLAVQLKGDDGDLRHRYGTMLVTAGRLDEAVAQLRKAVELEPYHALSHLYLARILEHQQNLDAIGFYKSFIERAESSDPQVQAAKLQLADLEAWAKMASPAQAAPPASTTPPAKP
jgi:Tfp pilus assembly protein PilF